MLAAKNFQSGLSTVRHLEFALFDMLLHSAFDPRGGESPQALLDDVRREVAVVPRAPYDRFMQSFAHVFAGGYAAGYYSYKWAEVLSADAFSAVRGGTACFRRPPARASATKSCARRQPAGAGVVRRLPRPAAPTRRPSAA